MCGMAANGAGNGLGMHKAPGKPVQSRPAGLRAGLPWPYLRAADNPALPSTVAGHKGQGAELPTAAELENQRAQRRAPKAAPCANIPTSGRSPT